LLELGLKYEKFNKRPKFSKHRLPIYGVSDKEVSELAAYKQANGK
jgi:hypothetical protein